MCGGGFYFCALGGEPECVFIYVGLVYFGYGGDAAYGLKAESTF
ncbi:hypothetical protein LDG_5698 [Legionella drancourtii LLAP12]|uniref:Uncharacterized protein n=1 Tax=Legionella drancourtii LLAP12 TaxID=658187 RepID=G9EKG5_9GAMM|nr:hypothetical protein LDG_5698 [Legionella drancourtii LLAP12]